MAKSNAHNDRKTSKLEITPYRPIFAKVAVEDETAADRIVYVTGSLPTQPLWIWGDGKTEWSPVNAIAFWLPAIHAEKRSTDE